jgi:hypothetical protein
VAAAAAVRERMRRRPAARAGSSSATAGGRHSSRHASESPLDSHGTQPQPHQSHTNGCSLTHKWLQLPAAAPLHEDEGAASGTVQLQG